MKDNFAQQVKFEIKTKDVATMVINGIAQQSKEVSYVSVVCPQCGCELIAFQEGIPLVEIYKELARHSPLEEFPKYCHECGTKLICDKSIVSEQVYEEK